jgi:hypothetical protein
MNDGNLQWKIQLFYGFNPNPVNKSRIPPGRILIFPGRLTGLVVMDFGKWGKVEQAAKIICRNLFSKRKNTIKRRKRCSP